MSFELKQSRQQGVALLEVLIAVVVIAFGFLALLKLQITSLNNVVASNQRYVAAELSQTMGERIRANFSGLVDYNGLDTRNFGKDCSSGCAQVKDNDAYAWKKSLQDAQDALPGGYGTVAINGQNAVIEIVWQEKRNKQAATEERFFLEVPINDNL